MKRCTHCQQEKPDEAFYAQANTKDRLGSWCKACMKTLRRKKTLHGRWGEIGDPSTLLVKELLEAHGIPCTPGSGAFMSYVDLAA